MTITRREALAGAAALGAAAFSGQAHAQSASAPFLRTDIGTLKRVFVHSVTETDYPVDALGEDLLPYAETDMAAVTQQHQGLMALLRQSGAELVELKDALTEAMAATRPSGVFMAWLDAAHPRLSADPDAVTPDMLLGRDPATQYRLREDGGYRHFTDDTVSTIFTRDAGFMTPQGMVICNSASRRRLRENMLLRFLFSHAPQLSSYPIAFDAVEEGIILEGGDAQVVDERTLFLGVGNRTDPRVAPVLARRLNMDVLTVQTTNREFLRVRQPGAPVPLMELRILFLHLDTYFTHVAAKHALAFPYVLEQEHAGEDPFSVFVRGARAETSMSEEDATAALDMLKELGRVKLYRRGTGAADDLGEMKLLDYVRRQRYRVTYTGGPLPSDKAEAFAHFMRVTYPEHRRQATNVVQAAPGRVIAYDGNPATKAALEADGVAVDVFGARELWAWHGGPHCLTMPLERT